MARIGRYELLGVPGRGAQATVYQARIAGGAEKFALKVLDEPNLELMERLRRGRDPDDLSGGDIANDPR